MTKLYVIGFVEDDIQAGALGNLTSRFSSAVNEATRPVQELTRQGVELTPQAVTVWTTGRTAPPHPALAERFGPYRTFVFLTDGARRLAAAYAIPLPTIGELDVAELPADCRCLIRALWFTRPGA